MDNFKGGVSAKFKKDVIRQKHAFDKEVTKQKEELEESEELPIANVIGIRKLPQIHAERHPVLKSVAYIICFCIIALLIFLSAFAITSYISPEKGQEIVDVIKTFASQCQFYWEQFTNK